MRQFSPALQWFRTQLRSSFAITPIVWMELVYGAPNKIAQRRVIRLLAPIDMVYLEYSDVDWAMQQLAQYCLSHNIGILDCLTVSVSHRLQIPLYTINLKHFVPIIGALAQMPYQTRAFIGFSRRVTCLRYNLP